MALSARIPPQKQVLPEEASYSLFSSFLNPFCENKFSATKQPYYTLPFGKRQSFPAIIDRMRRKAGADGGTGKSRIGRQEGQHRILCAALPIRFSPVRFPASAVPYSAVLMNTCISPSPGWPMHNKGSTAGRLLRIPPFHIPGINPRYLLSVPPVSFLSS